MKLTPNALRSLEKRCARLASQACNVRDRVSDALFTSPPGTFTEEMRADLIAARIVAEDARLKLRQAEHALSRARLHPSATAPGQVVDVEGLERLRSRRVDGKPNTLAVENEARKAPVRDLCPSCRTDGPCECA